MVRIDEQQLGLFHEVYRNPLQLKTWNDKDLREFGTWLQVNRGEARIVKYLPTVLAYFPVERDFGDSGYVKTFSQQYVRSAKEDVAFGSLMENPEEIQELDATYLHGLALWVIAQGNQIDEGRYQSFFAHVSAEKLSPDQKAEISEKRVERDFPDVEKPDTLEKAAALAKEHFSDETDQRVLAGKQRVLAVLTKTSVEDKHAGELYDLIYEVMTQLRTFQREHYRKGYLGERKKREVTPKLEEGDLKCCREGPFRLRLHRIWEMPLFPVEWSKEACEMLTEGEIKEVIENNPTDELLIRVMAKAVKENNYATIDWSKVSFKQRKQIKDVSFQGKELQIEFCKKFAAGLKAEEVVAVFGNGLFSATLLKQLKLSQEGIKWDKEAQLELEGGALVEMVKTGFTEEEQQNFRVGQRLKTLGDQHQADLFVFYHGDVPGIEWRLNLKLTFEMKQECAEHYASWGNFPTSLREAFHPIELMHAFDFVIKRQWGDADQLAGLKWENASDDQRRKGSFQALKINKNVRLAPFAEGLDSKRILQVWKFTETAARMHIEKRYSLEGIEWGAGVGPHLEGKVLAQWLNRHQDQVQLERLLASEDGNTHASLLNEARKKEAIEIFIQKGWINPPDCLREYCTRAQHHQLFGLTFGDKVGIALTGLLSLFGLYQFYKRWKKA